MGGACWVVGFVLGYWEGEPMVVVWNSQLTESAGLFPWASQFPQKKILQTSAWVVNLGVSILHVGLSSQHLPSFPSPGHFLQNVVLKTLHGIEQGGCLRRVGLGGVQELRRARGVPMEGASGVFQSKQNCLL